MHKCDHFLALPDELSTYILAEVLPDRETMFSKRIVLKYYHQLCALICICRRTHDLIYSKASFWTIISNKYDSEFVDSCLMRSRDSKLRIFVEYRQSIRFDGLRFLEKVLPLHSRWQSFSITYTFGLDPLYVQSGYRLMKDIHASALRSIEWVFVDDYDDGEEFHAYRTWNAPLLRHFSGQDIVPIFEADSGPQLQLASCKLEYAFRGELASNETLVCGLTSAIASQSSLEELDLEIRTSTPSDEDVDIPARVICRSLRTVTFESIRNLRNDWEESLAHALLQCLELPAIESMTLSVPLIGASISDLLPSFNTYSNLHHLDLTLYSNEDWSEESDSDSDFEGSEDEGIHSEFEYKENEQEDSDCGEYEYEESNCEGSVHEIDCISVFSTVFTRAQNLRSLRIYVNNATIEETDLSTLKVAPPPLHQLHLYHTPGISLDTVFQIVQYLSRGASWDRFHTLRIDGCPQLKGCHKKLSANLSREKILFLD